MEIDLIHILVPLTGYSLSKYDPPQAIKHS